MNFHSPKEDELDKHVQAVVQADQRGTEWNTDFSVADNKTKVAERIVDREDIDSLEEVENIDGIEERIDPTEELEGMDAIEEHIDPIEEVEDMDAIEDRIDPTEGLEDIDAIEEKADIAPLVGLEDIGSIEEVEDSKNPADRKAWVDLLVVELVEVVRSNFALLELDLGVVVGMTFEN
jgi:hypothetical protein